MSQDTERSEKRTPLQRIGPKMGLWGVKCEVGSGKWGVGSAKQRNIRSLSVQSTNPGSLAQNWVLEVDAWIRMDQQLEVDAWIRMDQ